MNIPKLSKYQKGISALLGQRKQYSLDEALNFVLNQQPKRKFVEALDVSVNLGVDPRKSDQAVRGSLVLPHGTGKSVRVAVFTSSANQEKAQAAGADLVGMEDLADQVKSGNMNFDMVLATPDAMRIVGQLGQILGPRGLMPNPKDGTVTADIVTAVKNAKMGQVRYRTDKAGVVHCTIGKANFNASALKENLAAVLGALKKAKPVSSKGIYFKKVTLSTTMGPGLTLDLGTLGL